jgi:formyltetrahydrofolate synthetase
MGMEKFFDIKCRYSGLVPNAVVIVATIRALKMHGGGPRVVSGQPLDVAYTQENLALLEKGGANLVAHLENVRKFGVPAVVAVNRFPTDTDAEIELVKKMAQEAGAEVMMANHWAEGGDGAAELAKAVVAACEKPSNFNFLYPLEWSIKQKIEKIAIDIYGADGVTYEPTAERQIKNFEEAGFGKLPICMAKTHLSISHDPNLKGRPKGFIVPIREVRASVGAGFIYPLLGTMNTIPGLATKSAFMNVDIDLETGKVVGLF